MFGATVLVVLLSAGAAQSLTGSNTVFSDDIVDGSGLSRLDRLTSQALVAILQIGEEAPQRVACSGLAERDAQLERTLRPRAHGQPERQPPGPVRHHDRRCARRG